MCYCYFFCKFFSRISRISLFVLPYVFIHCNVCTCHAFNKGSLLTYNMYCLYRVMFASVWCQNVVRVTASLWVIITIVSSYNVWINHVCSVLGYAMLRARPIKFHTARLRWAMTSTKINWIKSTRSQKRMAIAMKINIYAGRGWKLFITPSSCRPTV